MRVEARETAGVVEVLEAEAEGEREGAGGGFGAGGHGIPILGAGTYARAMAVQNGLFYPTPALPDAVPQERP